MKMRAFFALSLLFIVSASAIAQKKGYSIDVRIGRLKDTVCHLAYHYGDKQYIKDTAVVNAKGQMTFTGSENLPGGIYMVVMPSKNYFEFLITESGDEMEKKPVFQTYSMETDSSDLIGQMKFKNSSQNDLFYNYLRFVAERGKKNTEIMSSLDSTSSASDSAAAKEKLVVLDKEVLEYRDKFIEEQPDAFLTKVFRAMKDPVVPDFKKDDGTADQEKQYYYFKAHLLDGIDFSDDRMVRTPIFHSKIKQYFEKFTMQTPDSVIGGADYLIGKAKADKELFKYTTFYVTYTVEVSQIMCMEKAFVHLVDKYYSNGQAFWLNEKQLKRLTEKAEKQRNILCGMAAPNMAAKDMAGNTVYLQNLSKAEYMILVFWDPNCGHCKKEIPKLKTFYDEFRQKNGSQKLEVVAVCIEENKEALEKFINEHKLNWINVLDSYNHRLYFDVTSTPQVYLLNKKREITAKKLGVEQLGDLMERLLKSGANPVETKEQQVSPPQANPEKLHVD